MAKHEQHFVKIPKDLSLIRQKVFLGLTKRQLICFGIGAAIGFPAFYIFNSLFGLQSGCLALGIGAGPAIFCLKYWKDSWNTIALSECLTTEISAHRKKEGDNLGEKTKNAKKTKQPIQLTKEQVKQIQRRMSELKKKNTNNKSSTQAIIPYTEMFRDGICYIGENRFSRTIEFFDTNYEIVDFENKNSIFFFCFSLLNFFDDSIDFQFSYENQKQNLDEELKKLRIAPQQDKWDDVRKEYSDMLCRLRKSGKNGYVLRKFLTFTISEKSIKAARTRLDSIANEIIRLFTEFQVKAFVLDGKKRLETMYRSLNPDSEEPFIFDWELKARGGYSTKDFIAPMSAKFKKNRFEVNDSFGTLTSVDILAGELSDRML